MRSIAWEYAGRKSQNSNTVKKTGALLLPILFGLASYGQTLNIAKLDSFFNALAVREMAFGSLAISKNGSIQYQRAIGYSVVDTVKKIPANIATKYRIGSETKMFTAVMIFQLIEEGSISPGQKLDAYFPALPNAGKISISNLLNHRSGLHDYTKNTDFAAWMDKPKTHEEMLKIIEDGGTDFEPGARAEYCNTNYLLLGYIVEKVCKMSYSQALSRRITSKTGLQNTRLGTSIGTTKNESFSYKYNAGKWRKEKETHMSIYEGAGSIVSTPTDMVAFIEALFSYKLVSRSSLQAMQALEDGYGMGLFPFTHDKKIAFGHNGRIEEFYSTLQYFPGHNLAISYITNGILYPRADIVEGIVKICFEEAFTIPFSKAIVLESGRLDQYTGKYSAAQPPVQVNVTTHNNRLLLETQGATFEAEPIAVNYFMHAGAGYFFEFHPGNDELQIKETDNIYYLKRQK